MLPRPSTAALRAIHQYRQRDVVPYLALRYYLANRSARRERWGSEVAVRLVLGRRKPVYFVARNFKGRSSDGDVEHRDLFLPCANEALAESVLLSECAKHTAFQNPGTVFSYHLASDGESDGMFRHYVHGLKQRQEWIAEACRRHAPAKVLYSDIRKFYPSVSADLAQRAWEATSAQAELPTLFTRLGSRLLDDHVARAGSLLTGPMLSHLVGNLVLRGLDREMSNRQDLTYCRYVDDIVLVGKKATVHAAHREVEEKLSAMGLALHPRDSEKHLVVDGQRWLEGEHDYAESTESAMWKNFVGGIKWLLTSAPSRRNQVSEAFRGEGFRLPVADYSRAVREKSYVERLKSLVALEWFWGKRRSLEAIVSEGRVLRDRYAKRLDVLLGELHSKRDYDRKRLLPQIRFRAGRLAYLASPQHLASISEQLRPHNELEFHAVVLKAVATGDVTEALMLGTNVAQSVAQPLRSEGRDATVQGPIDTDVGVQGLAVLALNGVSVSGAGVVSPTDDALVRFARHGGSVELLRSPNAFISEFAALHGVGPARHAETLDSAFDAAENSVFDAVSQAVYMPSDW